MCWALGKIGSAEAIPELQKKMKINGASWPNQRPFVDALIALEAVPLGQRASIKAAAEELGIRMKDRKLFVNWFGLEGGDLPPPLHTAVIFGDEEELLRLLMEGTDVCEKMRIGDHEESHSNITPLHIACDMGRMNIAKILLDHGASTTDTMTRSYHRHMGVYGCDEYTPMQLATFPPLQELLLGYPSERSNCSGSAGYLQCCINVGRQRLSMLKARIA